MGSSLLRFTSLLMVFLLVGMAFSSLSPAAQALEEEKPEAKKAEALLRLALRTGERVGWLLEKLELRGFEVPEEAKEAYAEGKDLLRKASTLLEEGKYEETIEASLEALAKFKQVLILLDKEDLEKLRAKRLEEAINRAEKFIEGLSRLAMAARGWPKSKGE